MRKKAVDSTYFNKINSEEKAYFLGYILCDGCVHVDACGYFKFCFSSKDLHIIERLKSVLNSDHKISSHKRGRYHQINISDFELCKSLIKLGVIPRKSWNQQSCYVPKGPLLTPFVRGLIDGDGMVATFKVYGGGRTYVHPRVCFYNLNLHLHKIIKDFCDANNIDKVVTQRWNEKKTWQTRIGGKQEVCKFLTVIYANSSVYLDRKHKKAMEILDTYLTQDKYHRQVALVS